MALVIPSNGVSANPAPSSDGANSSANAGAVSGSQSGAQSVAVGFGGQSSSTSGAIGVGGDARSGSSSGVQSSIAGTNSAQQASTSSVTLNSSSERPIIPGEVIVSPTNTTTDCRSAKSGGLSGPFAGIGVSGTSVDEDCRFRVRARDMASYGGDFGLNIACQMYYDRKEYADDVKAAMDKLGVNCRELKRPAPVAGAPVPVPVPVKPAPVEEEHIDPPTLGAVDTTGALPMVATAVVQPVPVSVTYNNTKRP